MASEATLTVFRPSRAWIDRKRTYAVLVDDVSQAVLSPGQAMSFPVTPGRHAVRVRIDWTGSPEVLLDALPGQEIHLRVEPRANPMTVLWYLFGTTRYLKLTQVAGTRQ